jgi:hypothetical protein
MGGSPGTFDPFGGTGGGGGGDDGGVRTFTNTGKFDPNAGYGVDVGGTHITGRGQTDPRTQTASSTSPNAPQANGARFFPAGTPVPPGLKPVNQPGYGYPTMMGGYYA